MGEIKSAQNRKIIAECISKSQVKRVACLKNIDVTDALRFWEECESKWNVEDAPKPKVAVKKVEEL